LVSRRNTHSQEEIKIAFYNGQPEAWKLAFTSSMGNNVSTLSIMKFYLASVMKKTIPTSNSCKIPLINNVWGTPDKEIEDPEGTITREEKTTIVDHMLDTIPAMNNKFDLASRYQLMLMIMHDIINIQIYHICAGGWGQCFLYPTLGEGNHQCAGCGGQGREGGRGGNNITRHGQ
jgi:hypothetical protein